MKLPFDELNMGDGDHVEWVKSQRDIELWHVAAIAITNYLGDPHSFLPWLFAQDEVDRATAGYVFLGASGLEYLGGQAEWYGEGLSQSEWLNAMHAICHRAASSDFSSDELGLASGFEDTRQLCLEAVRAGAVASGIEIPVALISKPFPPEQKLCYFIEDGAILDYDPNS